MSYFDWFVIICIAAFAVRGLMKGIMKEMFTLGGLVLGIILGRLIGPSFGASLMPKDPTGGAVAGMLGYAIVFFIVMLGSSVAAFALKKLVKLVGFGWADRLLGMLLGVVLGLIIPGLFLYIVVFIKGSLTGTSIEHSPFAPFIMGLMKILSGLALPAGK